MYVCVCVCMIVTGLQFKYTMPSSLTFNILSSVWSCDHTSFNEGTTDPTVLQSKRANFVVFKVFCYIHKSIQEGSI